jgi:hypothetical protein
MSNRALAAPHGFLIDAVGKLLIVGCHYLFSARIAFAVGGISLNCAESELKVAEKRGNVKANNIIALQNPLGVIGYKFGVM